METSDIRAKVLEIDAEIRKNPWMDFEVVKYDNWEFIVIGNLSQSYPNRPGQVEISFRYVYFVSMPFYWKTDTSEQVFSLIDGPDFTSINKRFQVEQGYHLFIFKPEDYDEDFGCLIGAKELSYRVL